MASIPGAGPSGPERVRRREAPAGEQGGRGAWWRGRRCRRPSRIDADHHLALAERHLLRRGRHDHAPDARGPEILPFQTSSHARGHGLRRHEAGPGPGACSRARTCSWSAAMRSSARLSPENSRPRRPARGSPAGAARSAKQLAGRLHRRRGYLDRNANPLIWLPMGASSSPGSRRYSPHERHAVRRNTGDR